MPLMATTLSKLLLIDTLKQLLKKLLTIEICCNASSSYINKRFDFTLQSYKFSNISVVSISLNIYTRKLQSEVVKGEPFKDQLYGIQYGEFV
ncbi:CLUMA_CG003905, isoform A [Clunio marinus]|uniref:CLUMA_CG003905, isoform A n=1 Tax=Clunio marinus TaxID=568069 RepID=A0A1J1HQ69_9DIPT|nr:CLUMA_CG003905, isoform A [Clunio marinus]